MCSGTTLFCRLAFADKCPFGVVEIGRLTQEFEHVLAPWEPCPMIGGGGGYCLTRTIKCKRKIPKNPIAASDHVEVTSTCHIFAFGDPARPDMVYSCSVRRSTILARFLR